MHKRKLPVLNQAAAPPGPGVEAFDASRELPELHEASLDWEDVDCVLADLDDFVEIIELQGRSPEGAVLRCEDLIAARDRFVGGQLQGLQITYRFADQTWIDTLLREPSGARLLRMVAQT